MEHLRAIQQQLKAPKDLTNQFGGYKYRSAESILEAVKPLLDREEAIVTLSDEIMQSADRFYVKATATFLAGDFKYPVTAYAREQETKKGMDESQITGSASSYARKYALNGLFLIDDVKDADHHDNSNESNESKGMSRKSYRPQSAMQDQPATPKQLKYIEDLYAQNGGDPEMLATLYKSEGVNGTPTVEQAKLLIAKGLKGQL